MDMLTIYGACERFYSEAARYPDWQLARITAQHKGLYKAITPQGEILAGISGKFRHAATGACNEICVNLH